MVAHICLTDRRALTHTHTQTVKCPRVSYEREKNTHTRVIYKNVVHARTYGYVVRRAGDGCAQQLLSVVVVVVGATRYATVECG